MQVNTNKPYQFESHKKNTDFDTTSSVLNPYKRPFLFSLFCIGNYNKNIRDKCYFSLIDSTGNKKKNKKNKTESASDVSARQSDARACECSSNWIWIKPFLEGLIITILGLNSSII